jgi:cell division protein ZapA (FtsZ GTPase activity inhibitor)
VHNPAGNAIEAIKAYGFEQRDLAVNKLEHVTADLDQRIRAMRGRSKAIASDRREDWNAALTKLELKRDELEVSTTRIKFATEDKWDDAKGSAVDTLEEVQDLLEELQGIVRE